MADEQTTEIFSTACGGRLKDTTGYPSFIYQGKLVYFCNEDCLRAFLGDKERFMAGEIEHPA